MSGEEVSPDDEWIVSLVAEAFSCRPSEAIEELSAHPDLVFAILDLRAYARGYAEYQGLSGLTAKAKREVLRDPMVQAAQANEYLLMQQAQEPSGSGDG